MLPVLGHPLRAVGGHHVPAAVPGLPGPGLAAAGPRPVVAVVRWPWSRPEPPAKPQGPHQCPATARAEEAVAMLSGLAAAGHAQVSVQKVLAVLDPGHEKREKRGETDDPVTGAKWPGPPGSRPPAAGPPAGG